MSSFKNVDEYLNKFKEKKQRQKEALERKKQRELDNIKHQQKKAAVRLENSLYEQQRTIHIYNTRYIQKGFDDSEVYTRFELEHIETLYPREYGRINWLKFDELVKQIRNIL